MGGESGVVVVQVAGGGYIRVPLTPRVRSWAAPSVLPAAALSVRSSWAFCRWMLRKVVCQSADLVDSRNGRSGEGLTMCKLSEVLAR